MTAEQFLIKKIKPRSGNLKSGIINTDYAAELMEEYTAILKNQINQLEEEISALKSNLYSKED